jgi:hypothetical protein
MRQVLWVWAVFTLFGALGCDGSDSAALPDGAAADSTDTEVSTATTADSAELTDATDATAPDGDGDAPSPPQPDVAPDAHADAAGADTADSGGDASLGDVVVGPKGGYSVAVVPGIGQWSSAVGPNDDCVCSPSAPSCHALYKARTAAIDGHMARIEAEKLQGGGPSADVPYWIASPASAMPSCVNLASSPVLQSGMWKLGARLSVEVPIWPTAEALELAPCGETRFAHVISAGSDDTTAKRWFQGHALRFTKVCSQPCPQNCKEKQCGGDGCGGSCGTCSGGASCLSGVCKIDTKPKFLWGMAEPITWNALGLKKLWPLEQQMALLEPLGSRIFQVWFYAGHLHSAPGEVIESKVALYDDAIARLVASGQVIVGMDHGLPEWMTGFPNDAVPCRDTTPGSAYLAFLERFEEAWRWKASHFKDVRYWQVGNEPNVNVFLHTWGSCGGEATLSPSSRVEMTVDMMFHAARGVKTGNPEAFVFMPGIAPESDVQFLKGIYARIESGEAPSNDPRDYFDGACWHPYSNTQPTVGSWVAHNLELHAVLEAHGDGEIPVLFSEVGHTDFGDAALWDKHADWLLASSRLAAEHMPWLWGVTWFRLFDDPTQPSGHPESGFGVLTAPPDVAVWKPAAFAFESIANSAPPSSLSTTTFEFGTPGGTEGVSGAGVDALKAAGGWLFGEAVQADAYLETPTFAAVPAKTLHLRMATWAGSTATVQLRADAQAPWSSAVSRTFPVIADGKPHDYEVELSPDPGTTAVALRLVLPAPGAFAVDSIRLLRGAP